MNNPDDPLEYDEKNDFYFTKLSNSKGIEYQSHRMPIFDLSNSNSNDSFFKVDGSVDYNTSCYRTNWRTLDKYREHKKSLVENFDVEPYWSIGCLATRNQYNINYGSAVQIAPGYIVTAAHNICTEIGNRENVKLSFAEAISFYPFMCDAQPKIVLQGEAVALNKNFYDLNISNEDRNFYDFALIKLASSQHSGHLKLPDDQINGISNISVIGYPGVIPYSSNHMTQIDYRLDNKRNNIHITDEMIYYEGNLTYTGHSGSAIVNTENGSQKLIGLHTHIDRTEKRSGGIVFSKKNVETINKWSKILPKINVSLEKSEDNDHE